MNEIVKPVTSHQRLFYMDFLKAISCFGVVLIHTSQTYQHFSKTAAWTEGFLIMTLVRWCVPIFFMLTGATLLEYRSRYSTMEFFKKRMLKVFIPFIIWTVIYFVWRISLNEIHLNSWKDIIKLVTTNKVNSVFWFFYALFPLYLSIPVISLLIKKENRKTIIYFLFLCVLNISLLPMLPYYFHLPYIGYLNIPIGGGFLGYLLLGWILKDTDFKRRARYLIYISGALSWLVGFLIGYYRSFKLRPYDNFTMNYPSIFIFVFTVAVFVLIKNTNWEYVQNRLIGKVITNISKASLGIYFIHIMVVYCFTKYVDNNVNSLTYMLGGAVIVFLVSLVTILAIKQIPILKNLVP